MASVIVLHSPTISGGAQVPGTEIPAFDIRLREKPGLATWGKTRIDNMETAWMYWSLEQPHLKLRNPGWAWRLDAIVMGSWREGARSTTIFLPPMSTLRLQHPNYPSSRIYP